jgi:hypothetical protein
LQAFEPFALKCAAADTFMPVSRDQGKSFILPATVKGIISGKCSSHSKDELLETEG